MLHHVGMFETYVLWCQHFGSCMQNQGLAQNVAMSFGEPEKNRSEEVRNYNPTPFTKQTTTSPDHKLSTNINYIIYILMFGTSTHVLGT